MDWLTVMEMTMEITATEMEILCCKFSMYRLTLGWFLFQLHQQQLFHLRRNHRLGIQHERPNLKYIIVLRLKKYSSEKFKATLRLCLNFIFYRILISESSINYWWPWIAEKKSLTIPLKKKSIFKCEVSAHVTWCVRRKSMNAHCSPWVLNWHATRQFHRWSGWVVAWPMNP